MAKSSKFLRLDTDVLLEFIYHDQSNPIVSEIKVDDSGSHIKFLNTVENDNNKTRYLIHELGGDVVNFTVNTSGKYIVINDFASRELQLQNGKTYKFNLSALSNPSNFSISGGGSYTLLGNVGTYIPNTNGTYKYSYENLNEGFIQIRDNTNSYYSTPDQETGNTIKAGAGEIGRYYAIVDNVDGTRFALLDNTLSYLETQGWNGTKSEDLLPIPLTGNLVNYDTIRLHLRSGYSFSGRGYEGFIFQVKAKRKSGIYNFFTSLAYLNSSNYEVQNPNPFVLSGTSFSKFIEIKVPSLVDMYDTQINLDFQEAFFGLENSIDSVNPTTNYEISYKLIDKITDISGIKYADTSENLDVTIPREDEYQDIAAVVEEAGDGDYFNMYGIKDGSIANFSQYILDRIQKSSDDITVFYDIEVMEQIGLVFATTFLGSYVQTDRFDEPINFRPIIKNANVAVSFVINLNLRIYNSTNNTQILKQASLVYKKPSRYGRKMMQLALGNNVVNKVYNTIASTQTNTAIEAFVNSIRSSVGETRYVPVAIDTINIMAGNSQVVLEGNNINTISPLVYQPEGEGIMRLSKVADSFIKFKIVQSDGNNIKTVSLVNADSIDLLIKSGNIEQKISADYSFPDIDMGNGEVIFKVTKAISSRFDQPDTNTSSDKFYINITNGSTSTTLYYGIVEIV